MTLLLRLLTVVEIILFIRRLKEGEHRGDVAQEERRDDSRVPDSDRPTRNTVLDDAQTQSH